jgi:N-acetyl-alpha-D-glucosaminyl L-malate synthase BshA
MNIGIVCYPTYGGSGVLATELGIALSKKGHEVHFISSSLPARLDAYYANIHFHEVRNMRYPLFEYTPYETALASKIVDVMTYEKLDVLHVHYAVPHASSAYMTKQILKSKGINLPVITTLHGTDITLVGNDPSYAPVVEFSINMSDGVTAVSQSLKKDTLYRFNVKKEIQVIDNFIDKTKFQRTFDIELKKRYGEPDDIFIVHVSNFRPVKRVMDVIKSWEIVNEINPKVKLIMIGDGPERQKTEDYCRGGNCGSIHFLGKRDGIGKFLSICDVFLLPSEKESFGLAALEAMACGVPVISSNRGGLPEVNINGETGYTYDLGDINGMAEGIQAIIKDKDTWSEFSERCIKHSMQYDINMIVPQYEEYYKKIISQS